MNSLELISKPILHEPLIMDFDTWWEKETRRRVTRLKSILSIEDQDVYKQIAMFDAQQCRNSFLYWVSNYGWVTNPKHPVPARRQIPFVLWPKQYQIAKKAIATMKTDDKTVYLINKTREGGVSWIIVSVYYWMWRFHKNFYAKMGSRKQDLVDDKTIDSLFGKMRYIHEKQPAHLRERKVKDILLNFTNLRTGSEIIGESTNAGFGRGGRRNSILIDEFAHVPKEIAYQCWKSIESVSSSIILPSSPNGPANKFYELFTTMPADFVDEYDWSINPYRDENWKQNILLSLTLDEFNEEYGCSFENRAKGKVFKFDRIGSCFDEDSFEWKKNRKDAMANWPLLGGWDFGTGPSNTSCMIALLDYKENEEIPDIIITDEAVFNRTKVVDIAARVKEIERTYGNQHKVHFGDPTSETKESDQSSWSSNLRQGGINFFPLNHWYNTVEGINYCVEVVQWFLDSGKLKIHARCKILIESIINWAYNVPENIPIEFVSKEAILPRKDYYSHQTNALMYLCVAAKDVMCRKIHRGESLMKNSVKMKRINSLYNTVRLAKNVRG